MTDRSNTSPAEPFLPDPDGLYRIEDGEDGDLRFVISCGDFDASRLKRPSYTPPFPDKFFNLVGQITWQWGQYELVIDQILVLLLETRQGEEFELPKSFPKRSSMLILEVKRFFVNCPEIISGFETALSRSKPLHSQRNILVHGALTARVNFKPVKNRNTAVVKLVATALHQRRKVVQEFTLSQLETCFYRINDITSLLSNFLEKNVHFLDLSLHERSVLASFRRLLTDRGELRETFPFIDVGHPLKEVKIDKFTQISLGGDIKFSNLRGFKSFNITPRVPPK